MLQNALVDNKKCAYMIIYLVDIKCSDKLSICVFWDTLPSPVNGFFFVDKDSFSGAINLV